MNVTDTNTTDSKTELRITGHDDDHHHVTLTDDGTVTEHWCDTAPSHASDRTPIEQERFDRVQRFARYYLTQTTSTLALHPYSNRDRIPHPDHVTVTAFLIGAMSQATLTSHLQPCYEQLTGGEADETPPVTPPETSPDADWQRIEQDIHLDLPPQAIHRLAAVLRNLSGLGEIRRALDSRPDRADDDLFDRLERALSNAGFDPTEAATKNRYLRVISPLRVHYDADGPTRIEHGDETTPDADATLAARIQLTPYHTPIISTAALQRTLVDHFRCQLRDAHVAMGLRPPTDARITGPGIADSTDRYRRIDALQNYHNEHAIIDWNGLAPHPEL